MRRPPIALLFAALFSATAAEPPPAGWPLTAAERDYILQPEHARRPGAETKQHLPDQWPVTPSAGHWGGTRWLEAHTKLVEHVQANRGPIDILLIGDSITQQWGSVLDGKPLNAAWQKHFGRYRTVNLGIAGDKTQNVLWRLDHGGVDGLQPRLVVLLIGNNNCSSRARPASLPRRKGSKPASTTFAPSFRVRRSSSLRSSPRTLRGMLSMRTSGRLTPRSMR